MPVYFEAALKVSLSLAAGCLFYNLLLKRMTHYRWNRYFLLLFQVLSFMVPFINVDVFVQTQQPTTVSLISHIPAIHAYEVGGELPANNGMLIYQTMLAGIFLAVSAILFVRLLMQFLSIQKIRSKATVWADGEQVIYHVTEPILPFSFLNSIYINTTNYSDTELKEIIRHERVHVQQKHSIDMLVSEIICILNWYNPFAWMIKKAIRENLEFIADDAVVSKGANKKSYQYLLLKVTGDLPASIASSLKFSSLKNRIIMMNKRKTSRLHLMKFVLIVPVATLLLLAFRNNTERTTNNEEVKNSSSETYILTTLTYSIPDTKAKAIVLKEQRKSLLKVGDSLNLKQIFNEKARLKSLLEKNGYNNLKSNAIMFWVDTASVKNSFTVEVKIDVEPAVASADKKTVKPLYTEVNTSTFGRVSSLVAAYSNHDYNGRMLNRLT